MSDASTADADLLAAWRGGDRKAGSALYERYFPLIYRFFRFKVDDDAIVDLVQSTFIGCVEGVHALRDEASYRSYALAVARHKLADFYRARGCFEGVALDEVSVAQLDPSPSSLLRRGRAQRVLLAAIRSLPLELQILLELFYWEEIPSPELATILAIPEGTVRSRLRRARELLRQHAHAAQLPAPADDAEDSFERWAKEMKAALD